MKKIGLDSKMKSLRQKTEEQHQMDELMHNGQQKDLNVTDSYVSID